MQACPWYYWLILALTALAMFGLGALFGWELFKHRLINKAKGAINESNDHP
jgi:predicted negative regulator of RcsB-dependent stress response